MGYKFNRKKTRNILTSFIYKMAKLKFTSDAKKFKIYSNLSWIFNRLSQEYSFGAIYPHEHPARILTLNYIKTEVNENDTILDLGCSNGDYSYELSKICKEVVGIDYNTYAIEQAKEKFKNQNLSFYCMDAILYFKNFSKTFDILICSHLLEHLDDPENFLLTFKKYFKKIYIEVPDFNSSFDNIIREKIGLLPHYTDADHINEYSREEIENLIHKLNLKIIKCEFRYGVMRYWATQ